MKINELSGKKKMINNGCIKSKDGKILMNKEEQLTRWAKYLGELYSDSSRQEDFVIDAELEGPPIMQSEIGHALSRTKHGKAAGPDNVYAEKLSTLEDIGIEQLTKVMNEVYHTGCIPNDLL